MAPRILIVGRFPPPFDGQALATQRCADMLEGSFAVQRFNTEPPGGPEARTEPRLDFRRGLRFLQQRRQLEYALASAPHAPVLWHAVSPTGLGHARDVLVTLPTFGRHRPVVAVLHRATYARLFEGMFTARTAHRIRRRVRAWVTQSRSLGKALSPYIPQDQIRVIPNTISTSVQCTDQEIAEKLRSGSARRDPAPFRILFLSNMIPEKGYLDVLEAVALLHRRGVTLRAEFAGGWPDEASLRAFEERKAELDLVDVVHHHGKITQNDSIKRLHLAADAFVLPTYHPTETQPIAILEALNAATPVVATDRAIVHDIDGAQGTILTVPPRSPQAIAAALRRLTETQTWLSTAYAARRRFLQAFSPQAVGASWRRVAAEAISWSRPPSG